MRNTILVLAIILIFGALNMLFDSSADVRAIGVSSDNSTIPNFPVGDQAQDEIAPPVKYVLLGPTLQAKSSPPNIIPSFIGVSERDKFTITAHENWYLHIDINAPDWLYIYEYFTVGEKFSGKWIAYKWQLPQSGIWKLGPFTAGTDEMEGQHIYRFWFYSDGLWAGEDQRTSQNILIYWTYSKCRTDEQPANSVPSQPQTIVANKDMFRDLLRSLITKPIVLVLCLLILSGIVMFGLYMYQRYVRMKRIKDSVSLLFKKESENAVALPLSDTGAKIALPNGIEFRLVGTAAL